MPNRFIKESCRSSKNLCRLSDFEERLFWRLVTTADDFGRFLACPELVKSACFPYRTLANTLIKKSILSLQANELIKIYQVDDRHYGVFLKWEKHQGKPRAKTSKYPAMIADANTCEHLLANVPGGPNTNTETDSKTNPIPSLSSFPLTLNPKRSSKRAISDEDKPTEKHFAYGERLGVDVGPEWGKFVSYCKAHDKRYADFDAAFRNWLANAQTFKGVKHAMR